MKMIIKGNRMLLVVLALSMVVCFTGCTPDDGTRETEQLEEVQRETEEEVEETDEAEKEAERQLQIRKLEDITLDDKEAKLPYNIKMYDEATKAFENPVRIRVKKDEILREIFFSYTKNEDFSVDCIEDGVIVEQDEFDHGCPSYTVKTVGDIQTFSLTVSADSESHTVVYEIENAEEFSSTKNQFIAFYVIPE